MQMIYLKKKKNRKDFVLFCFLYILKSKRHVNKSLYFQPTFIRITSILFYKIIILFRKGFSGNYIYIYKNRNEEFIRCNVTLRVGRQVKRAVEFLYYFIQ